MSRKVKLNTEGSLHIAWVIPTFVAKKRSVQMLAPREIIRQLKLRNVRKDDGDLKSAQR